MAYIQDRTMDLKPIVPEILAISPVQIGASYPKCKVPFQFHFHDVYRVVYCVVPVTQFNILEASKDRFTS